MDYAGKLVEEMREKGLVFGPKTIAGGDDFHIPFRNEKGHCLFCDNDDSPKHTRRVEFRAAGEHSIGNREAYELIRKYPTHAETWSLTQTDHPAGSDVKYLRNMGIQDREGNWWVVWHAYHSTNERAVEHQTMAIQENLGSVWAGWNVFYGEL